MFWKKKKVCRRNRILSADDPDYHKQLRKTLLKMMRLNPSFHYVGGKPVGRRIAIQDVELEARNAAIRFLGDEKLMKRFSLDKKSKNLAKTILICKAGFYAREKVSGYIYWPTPHVC